MTGGATTLIGLIPLNKQITPGTKIRIENARAIVRQWNNYIFGNSGAPESITLNATVESNGMIRVSGTIRAGGTNNTPVSLLLNGKIVFS